MTAARHDNIEGPAKVHAGHSRRALGAAAGADMAKDVAAGMQAWLAAIPSELWQVFGVCFSVYGVTRTVEKVRGVAR